MKRTILSALLALGASAWAQMTPVGTWHTIDDKTGEVKSEVRITESGGVLTGKVEKLLRKGADQNTRCIDCDGDRKDQLVLGLEIIRGARKAAGKDVWEDGRILDPENGREYRLRLSPQEGGRRLEVRGYFGPVWRNQTWVRVQ